jgi:hypothetical protein
VFGAGSGGPTLPAVEVASCEDRRADAGKRSFRRSAQQSRPAERRKTMIDRAHDLPIIRQAEALRVSRCSLSYPPRSVPEVDLAIMRMRYFFALWLCCAGYDVEEIAELLWFSTSCRRSLCRTQLPNRKDPRQYPVPLGALQGQRSMR